MQCCVVPLESGLWQVHCTILVSCWNGLRQKFRVCDLPPNVIECVILRLTYLYFVVLKVRKPVFNLSTEGGSAALPFSVCSSAVIWSILAAATGVNSPFTLHTKNDTPLYKSPLLQSSNAKTFQVSIRRSQKPQEPLEFSYGFFIWVLPQILSLH